MQENLSSSPPSQTLPGTASAPQLTHIFDNIECDNLDDLRRFTNARNDNSGHTSYSGELILTYLLSFLTAVLSASPSNRMPDPRKDPWASRWIKKPRPDPGRGDEAAVKPVSNAK